MGIKKNIFITKKKQILKKMDFLGENVRVKSGDNMSVADLCAKNKVICLYFSAHWCPPCRGFTPVLAEFYKELKESGSEIEIVFVSSDRSPADFDGYYAEMPWACLPHGDDRVAAIKSKFGVSGIPMLV